MDINYVSDVPNDAEDMPRDFDDLKNLFSKLSYEEALDFYYKNRDSWNDEIALYFTNKLLDMKRDNDIKKEAEFAKNYQ